MHNYSDKKDEDLQREIERAFTYTEENAQGATTQTLRVLLVIAERNRREFVKLDKKNQIYTWVIIGLATVSLIASITQIYIALCVK